MAQKRLGSYDQEDALGADSNANEYDEEAVGVIGTM